MRDSTSRSSARLSCKRWNRSECEAASTRRAEGRVHNVQRTARPEPKSSRGTEPRLSMGSLLSIACTCRYTHCSRPSRAEARSWCIHYDARSRWPLRGAADEWWRKQELSACTHRSDGMGLDGTGCEQHVPHRFRPFDDLSDLRRTGRYHAAHETAVGSDRRGACCAPCQHASQWTNMLSKQSTSARVLRAGVSRAARATRTPNSSVQSSLLGEPVLRHRPGTQAPTQMDGEAARTNWKGAHRCHCGKRLGGACVGERGRRLDYALLALQKIAADAQIKHFTS